MEQEQWPLGTALAIVHRNAHTLRVRLQGVVTAMVLEALHLRLAAERFDRRELVFDHDAMMALTCRSAVEATLRGSAIGDSDLVHVGVPCTKLAWALQYCLLMTREGQPRVAFVLDRMAST